MNVMKGNKQNISIAKYTEMRPFSLKSRLKVFFQIKYHQPLDFPRQFWIEITNQCNLRCIMCPIAKGLPRKAMTMGFAEFKQIIDQIYMNKPSIMLHVAGEPLINPNVIQMIDYAKNKGCWVGMHTNATLLTREISNTLLATSLDSISFSFDGCTAEVYEKIRIGAKFEQVKAQIELFLKLREEKKVKLPLARIEILDMEQTRGEIDQFISFWQTTSVDKIGIRPAGGWLGAIKFANPIVNEKFGNRHCRDVLDKCAILVDGTVVPCCRDILGRLALGNIFQQSFDQIWNGKQYNKLRAQHFSNKVSKDIICDKCEYRKSWSRSEQIIQWLLKQFFWRNISGAKADKG